MNKNIRKFTHYVLIAYGFSLAALASFGIGYMIYAIVFLNARVDFLIG